MLNFLERNRIIPIILTILIAIIIFYISSLQFTQSSNSSTFSYATIYHLGIFFLLGFFLTMAVKGKKKINFKIILITLGISVIYGISDEVHQLFVPSRVASIKDVAIDIAGSFFAIIFNFKLEKTKRVSCG